MADQEIQSEAGEYKNSDNLWRFCCLYRSLRFKASLSISVTWWPHLSSWIFIENAAEVNTKEPRTLVGLDSASTAGKAQLIECPCEKAGAILTRVRAPVRQGFSLSQNQLAVQTPSTGLRHPSLEEGAGKRCSECACRADSLTVSIQPQCAVAYLSIARLKIPNTGSHTQTPNTRLRHPSFKGEGAEKRRSECEPYHCLGARRYDIHW